MVFKPLVSSDWGEEHAFIRQAKPKKKSDWTSVFMGVLVFLFNIMQIYIDIVIKKNIEINIENLEAQLKEDEFEREEKEGKNR
jgi:hypothetical protein